MHQDRLQRRALPELAARVLSGALEVKPDAPGCRSGQGSWRPGTAARSTAISSESGWLFKSPPSTKRGPTCAASHRHLVERTSFLRNDHLSTKSWSINLMFDLEEYLFVCSCYRLLPVPRNCQRKNAAHCSKHPGSTFLPLAQERASCQATAGKPPDVHT